MKGVTLFIEVSGPFQILPGAFRSYVGGGTFGRVWWLWFSVAFITLPLDVFSKALETGAIGWTNGGTLK